MEQCECEGRVQLRPTRTHLKWHRFQTEIWFQKWSAAWHIHRKFRLEQQHVSGQAQTWLRDRAQPTSPMGLSWYVFPLLWSVSTFTSMSTVTSLPGHQANRQWYRSSQVQSEHSRYPSRALPPSDSWRAAKSTQKAALIH